MMILVDGILAVTIMQLFVSELSSNLLACLALTCMITFLRMMMKLSAFIDTIYDATDRAYRKAEEELEKEESK